MPSEQGLILKQANETYCRNISFTQVLMLLSPQYSVVMSIQGHLYYASEKFVKKRRMSMSKARQNEKTLKVLATKTERRMYVQRYLLMISEHIQQCWTVLGLLWIPRSSLIRREHLIASPLASSFCQLSHQ